MTGLKTGIDPSCMVDDFNMLMYLVNTSLRGINTIDVVRVESVNIENKTITVLPVVQRANANGNPIPEGPIYGIKYIQWQYGSNMIKAVPEVGDIGIIVVCKKDISSIESGLVGSYREFSISDGIYIGGLFGFNKEPTQFIEFTENGIIITTPKTLTVNATENVVINGVDVEVNASGKANVVASEVNLGAEGGVAIARQGDSVVAGSTVIGTIQASSTVVKSI